MVEHELAGNERIKIMTKEEQEIQTAIDMLNSVQAADWINSLCTIVHCANARWWRDPKTGLQIQRNVGEMLLLAVSELTEAMEGHRKNLSDDKLPQYSMEEVEIADCIIRLFDYAAGRKLRLGQAFVDKMKYNAIRDDHKSENRIKEGGKAY